MSWSFGSTLAAKIAVLSINLIAVAMLPPAGYGQFVALQASALLGATAWDFGVSTLVTREVAAGRLGGRRLIAEVSRLRILTLVPAMAVIASGILIVGGARELTIGAVLASVIYMLAFGAQLALNAALRGHFRFREVAVGTAVGKVGGVASLAVTLGLAPPEASLDALLASLAVGELLCAGIALWQLGSIGEPDGLRNKGRVLTLSGSAPFAATSLMFVGYNRFDVVLIAALSSATVVGLYGPASRLQDMMVLVPSIVEVVLLPYASRLFVLGRAGVGPTRSIWLRLTGASVGLSVAAAFVVTYLAPTWVPRVLGQEYVDSIIPIQIIVWSVPLIAFNSALGAVISARHRPHYVTIGVATALATIVATDVLVVPTLGAPGAALAATVREIPFALVLLAGARASGLFTSGDR